MHIGYVNFQKRKIERLILKRGEKYKFTRYKKNEFNEVNTEIETTFEILGVFHISNKANIGSYVQVFNEDATRREARKQYSIITTYDNFIKNETKIDDVVEIAGKKYKVMAHYDIESLHYGVEISLEDIL